MTPVILVTGGHRGIGLGISRALIGAGHAVTVLAERAPEDDEVRDAMAELGPGANYFRHDMRDLPAIPRLLQQVRELGPLGGLVSNAGVSSRVRGDMLELGPDDYDTVMAINLGGAFFLAQAVARAMVAERSEAYRAMVFVTSVSADIVSVERADYCISKAGASMMARLFAARLAGEGIGVFEIRPGIIDTPMTRGVKDKYDRRLEEGLVPMGRWGEPRDIGRAVLPLMSGEMAFATGAVLPLDGGLSIHRL